MAQCTRCGKEIVNPDKTNSRNIINIGGKNTVKLVVKNGKSHLENMSNLICLDCKKDTDVLVTI